MAALSGGHLNPLISISFALSGHQHAALSGAQCAAKLTHCNDRLRYSSTNQFMWADFLTYACPDLQACTSSLRYASMNWLPAVVSDSMPNALVYLPRSWCQTCVCMQILGSITASLVEGFLLPVRSHASIH